MKLKDEDKAILLVASLPTSYKHFKEMFLYTNNDTLSFEDVKTNLLPKEKFNLEVHAKKGEALSVRGESLDKMKTFKSKIQSCKSSKSYRYCRNQDT